MNKRTEHDTSPVTHMGAAHVASSNASRSTSSTNQTDSDLNRKGTIQDSTHPDSNQADGRYQENEEYGLNGREGGTGRSQQGRQRSTNRGAENMQAMNGIQQYLSLIENGTSRYYRSINSYLESIRSVLAVQERQLSGWFANVEEETSRFQDSANNAGGRIEQNGSMQRSESGSSRSFGQTGRQADHARGQQSQSGH